MSAPFESIDAGDHDAPASPLVNASWPPRATHSAADAHEIALRLPLGLDTVLQAGVAALGSRVLSTLPDASTATHNDSLGHEIALSELPPIVMPDQLSGEAATAPGAASAASSENATTIAAALRAANARLVRCFDIDARPLAGRAVARRSLVIRSGVFEVSSV